MAKTAHLKSVNSEIIRQKFTKFADSVCDLKMDSHVQNILSQCAQRMYLLKLLLIAASGYATE